MPDAVLEFKIAFPKVSLPSFCMRREFVVLPTTEIPRRKVRVVTSQETALHARRWCEQDPDAGEADPDDVDGPTGTFTPGDPAAGSLTRTHLVATAEAVGLDEDLLDAIGQCL